MSDRINTHLKFTIRVGCDKKKRALGGCFGEGCGKGNGVDAKMQGKGLGGSPR